MCPPRPDQPPPPDQPIASALFGLIAGAVLVVACLASLGCGPDLSRLVSPQTLHSAPYRVYGAGCGLSRAVVAAHYPDDTAYLDSLCRLPSGQYAGKTKLDNAAGAEDSGVLGVGTRPDWHDVMCVEDWTSWAWYRGVDYLFPLGGGAARPVTGVTGNRYIVSAAGRDDLGVWIEGVETWAD